MDETRLNRMARLAREYCELVDQFTGQDPDGWLRGLANLLPQLHETVDGLEALDTVYAYESPPDFEARLALFQRLYSALGERNRFSAEVDLARDGQRLSGSLADDITDIYFDLKRGLQLLDQHPSDPRIAAKDWQNSFRVHWGLHLEDAERQLQVMAGAGYG